MPIGKSLRRAGAGFGSVARNIVDQFHLEPGIEQRAGGGDPVFDLRRPGLHELVGDREELCLVPIRHRGEQATIELFIDNEMRHAAGRDHRDAFIGVP